MMRFITLWVLYMSFFVGSIQAAPIEIRDNSEDILALSQVYIDTQNLQLSTLQKKAVFKSYDKEHINLGFAKGSAVWVKMTLVNTTDKTLQRVLEIHNPLLESVTLYDGDTIQIAGMLHLTKERRRNPAFMITLQSGESKVYYLQVTNSTTALRFGISLQDEITYIKDSYQQRMLIYIFFTIVLMLFTYNASLYFYTKESLYAYYCFYLLAIIAQQSTYLGVTQLYMPEWFIYYDNLSVLLKVNLMYITAALFAKSFLQTKKYQTINSIYNFFLLLSIIEIPLFGTPMFYYPEVGIVTALLFILFNMYSGFYIYKQGYKQARLFVIGWSFLVVGFILMIVDGLGLISVMHKVTDLIMFLIALEAMVLSLAFVDRYMILKREKGIADALLMEEYENRQRVIENKIHQQTKALNRVLEVKQTLLKELHHRTKNNLQLIISLVRMQSDSVNKETKEKFLELENRIRAISKTHEMLYLKDDLQSIDMHEYIEQLAEDLSLMSEHNVELEIEMQSITMPLKEASYIGLVINELITNSIKYVQKESIIISIMMQCKSGVYHLEYKDNGTESEVKLLQKSGLGIKLVTTLVEKQLDGVVKIDLLKGITYNIEFKL